MLLAAAIPAIAILLVWRGASTSGLSSSESDLVSPWIIAVITLVAGGALSWRAFTQRAEVSGEGLQSRNLTTNFAVPWDRVDRIEVVHRLGLVVLDVHLTGTRRRHRIGAASRFAGDEATLVLDLVAAVPEAAAKLELDAT